jgi:protease I
MKALILLADGFEDIQFFSPWFRLLEDNILTTIAAPNIQSIRGTHGYVVEPDMPIQEVNPTEYDLLLIPGGCSPEKLRLNEVAVDIARTLMEEDKIVAAIGHGAQLLISAQALDRRRLTCSPGIRDDVRAHATYRDEGAIIDGNLITCRGNDDLPMFNRRLMSLLNARART